MTNLFGLPESRPSRLGELSGTVPTGMAGDYQASVLHPQALRNPTLLEGVRKLMAPRPVPTGEPQEVPRGLTTATCQLPDTIGASQVVPDTDMRLRDAPTTHSSSQ